MTARVGPRVVLVGPMGAGKSTVAGLLAGRWGVTAMSCPPRPRMCGRL